jgi:hypothetical protein
VEKSLTKVAANTKKSIITVDRINAFGSLSAVIISIFSLYLQYGIDGRQTESEKLISRISTQMEREMAISINPRPMVVAKNERIEFPIPCRIEELDLDEYMTVRNMGKGNAHNVKVQFTYHDVHIMSDDTKKRTTAEIDECKFIVANELSLAPGEESKLANLAVPVAETELSQCVFGTADITCKNDAGGNVSVRQTFKIILHLNEDKPHGHFVFVTQFETNTSLTH